MSKLADTSHELGALSPSPRFMPPDWKPPAPAWSATFAQQATPVVMAYFGTQLKSTDSTEPEHQVPKFLGGTDAPANVERAIYVDRAGFRNFLSSTYWIDPTRYES
jgi:aldoxime dehydratase